MDSFPQLVSVGTYLAVCAFIYKLFEKGDDLINDDAKRQLEGWILNLKHPGRCKTGPPCLHTGLTGFLVRSTCPGNASSGHALR